ncbi:hypothetical protein ACFL6G_07885 [candidate division KSB1 bacterium]
MSENTYKNFKRFFIFLTAVIVLLEIRGIFDLRRMPDDGYRTDGFHTVIRILPDSPAEKAGFMLGDRILTDGGIDVEDTKALAERRPWAIVGERRTYNIERNGENMRLELTFEVQSGRQIALSVMRAVIGFSFLFIGLWSFMKVRNKSTALLTLVGAGLAVALINELYLSSSLMARLLSLRSILMIFGFVFFLHFMLIFPEEKPVMMKKNIMFILYSPAVLVSLFALSIIIFKPDRTGTLNMISNLLFTVYMVVCLVLSLITMIRSYIKTAPDVRSTNGLNFMLYGIVIGLIPIILTLTSGVIAPSFIPPGRDFYPVFLILIPFSLAYACVKTGPDSSE